MDQWYFSKDGEQKGPVAKAELQEMLASGKLSGSALVWSPSMTDWKAVSEVREFDVSPYATPYSPESVVAEGVDWSGYSPSGPQIRPWVRYWARTCDFLLFCIVVGGIVVPFVPGFDEMNDTLVGAVFLFAYCFVEPVLLSTIGTTPARALFRVRLRNADGTKLSYGAGLKRSLLVFLRGQALGIGVIALIASILAYRRLTQDGITAWDRDGNFTVSHQEISWWRWLMMIGGLVGFIALIGWAESL